MLPPPLAPPQPIEGQVGGADQLGRFDPAGGENALGVQHTPGLEDGAALHHSPTASGPEVGPATTQQPAGHGWGESKEVSRHAPDQQSGSAHQSQSGHTEPDPFGPSEPLNAQHQHSGETVGETAVRGGETGSSAGESSSRIGHKARQASDRAASESGRTAQHVGSLEHSTSSMWKWRHARPRFKLAVIGGTTVAAVATAGALTLANRNEGSSSAQRPPAVTTTTLAVAPVATAAAPVVVPAPAATEPVVAIEAPTTSAAPTTAVEVTTTVEATTTVPLLPSNAGTYSVTNGEITVSGEGYNTTVPGGDAASWTLTGPCDGVGDCSISADGTAAASTGVSPFAGIGTLHALVPAGSGTYTSTFELPIDECGVGVGNIVVTFADGVLTGSYQFAAGGSGACSLMLSTTFSGSIVG